ncbi:complement decay-accelerating factor isoform X2 [Toxotes jaculatrix]|uniref:complement decay-accelerating factor isoform X2 n=1 Tax=Toxotes jaculatrix TaxID=941984 RepID=UPI001B3ADE23|nr:complement decay-accelerating factor isoform X2 [Toxotes jaculatrix]
MDVLLDTCGRRRYLLLIYVFVLKATANCPRPQGKENTILTEESLLLNEFPEGSDVTLECANGYVIESGSPGISCVNGQWTEIELICKRKDCGPPKPQPNMRFNTSTGTLFGDIIRVSCDKGYQISGSSYKQCYSAGWIGRGKCEIEKCDIPAEVPNGRTMWDSQDEPKYGETVQFVCDEGYTLIGNSIITCGEGGQYDYHPPECRGVTTEDSIATKILTPTPTPPAQGGKTILTTVVISHITAVSTSTDSSATSTTHRDKTITTSAAPSVSPSARGGADVLTPKDEVTTTTVTSAVSSFQGKNNKTLNIGRESGYMPLIVSVIGVLVGVIAVLVILRQCHLRKKGSANGTVPICY